MLPLKSAMKNPSDFYRPAGVLNVGMIFVTTLFITFGFIGYWHWGENVAGSLTLNLPQHEMYILYENFFFLIVSCSV